MNDLNINTKEDLKIYCLQKLGWPAVDVEVTNEQLEDRIEEAIHYWHDIHYDGYEKVYLARRITSNDVTNVSERRTIGVPDQARVLTNVGSSNLAGGMAYGASRSYLDTTAEISNGVNIILDDSVKSVTRVLTPSLFNRGGVSLGGSHYRAHLAFFHGGGDLSSYYFFRLRIAEIEDLFQHERVITFKRHTNYLTIEGSNIIEGQWIVIECYRNIPPFRMPKSIGILSGKVIEDGFDNTTTLPKITIKINEVDEDILKKSINFGKLLENRYTKIRLVTFPQLSKDVKINLLSEYNSTTPVSTTQSDQLSGIQVNDGTLDVNITWAKIIKDAKSDDGLTIQLTMDDDFLEDVEDDDTISIVIDTSCHDANNEDAKDIWRWTDDTLHYIFPDSDLYGFRNVWRDRFIREYAYLLIKRQWGELLKKFDGIQLPSGTTVTGQQIYDEADERIREIDETRIENYSTIPLGRFG